MKVITKITDFIVPRFCTSCNTKLSFTEKFICNKCLSKVQLLSQNDIESEYKRKFEKTNFVDGYTSLYIFEEGRELQYLIHALKYDRKFKVGNFLGELLGKNKLNEIRNWNANIIIPVPLFHLKKIERGYNQADYIAKGLSKSIDIKTGTTIVRRIKNTATQTKFDKSERSKNMRNAFKTRKPKQIHGKNIIIVDDVITTGTTILELAKILKENGVAKVYALSVATPLISHSIRS